jgi:hypothetical protein
MMEVVEWCLGCEQYAEVDQSDSLKEAGCDLGSSWCLKVTRASVACQCDAEASDLL